jgi:hypothetical protein
MRMGDDHRALARELSLTACFLSQLRPFAVSVFPRMTPSLFITLYGILLLAPYSFLSLSSRNFGKFCPQLAIHPLLDVG